MLQCRSLIAAFAATLFADPTVSSGPVWTFQRGEDVIIVRCPEPRELLASEPTRQHARRFCFHTPHERVTFQMGFERHLLNTGWSLSAFTPSPESSGWLPSVWAFWRRRR